MSNQDTSLTYGTSDLVGELVAGRFRVDSYLGDGATGVVFKAHHVALARDCAIKVLKDTSAADGQLAARFRREGRAASRLDHPNIVYISDFGRMEDGRLYLVMEYIDGPSLRDVMADGPLPRARAFNVLRQIALALDAAHEAGVVHRDIKPENILLQSSEDGEDTVKVLDFSLAKIMDSSDLTALTKKGDLFGTPAYMSPEQVRSDGVIEPRTDLYAFGVLAFEAVTGRLPFEKPSIPGMMLAHRQEEPPTPSSRLPPGAKALPEELERLILRCLAKDQDERPDRGREVVAVLDQLWETERAPTSALTAPLSSKAGATRAMRVPEASALRTARRTWAREQTGRTAANVVRLLRAAGSVSTDLERVFRRIDVVEGQIAYLENDAAILHSQHQEQQMEARRGQARLRYAMAELSYERGVLAEQEDTVPETLEDFDYQIQELERHQSVALDEAERSASVSRMALQEMREREVGLRDRQRNVAREMVRHLKANPEELPESMDVRTEFEDLSALIRLADDR